MTGQKKDSRGRMEETKGKGESEKMGFDMFKEFMK